MAEIWAFIAQDSEPAADAFVHQLNRKFEPLREFPEMGAARDQLAPGLRALPFRDYVIYYLAEPDALVIVRVLHGARDARAIFWTKVDAEGRTGEMALTKDFKETVKVSLSGQIEWARPGS